jgi:hypothetical protein
MIARYFASTVALLLGACSMQPHESRSSFESASTVDASAHPMAQLPPAAGEQLAVLEAKRDGVLNQEIVLRGDAATTGENKISVAVDIDGAYPGETDKRTPKPTEELIAREIDAAFPTIGMNISTTYNRNGFGPFGYAIGHASGGVTCVYAWQWSAGRHEGLLADPEADAAFASSATAPTSIRVRLCKAGLGEQEIVALIGNMAVFPPGGGAPYLSLGVGDVKPTDALTAAGLPGGYYLGAAAAHASHRDLADLVPGRRHHRRHARRDGHEPAVADFAPWSGTTGSAVPMPADSTGGASASNNALLAPLQKLSAAAPSKQAAGDGSAPPALAKPPLGLRPTTAASGPAIDLPLPK